MENNFPSEWQEIILADEITGVKHIADVRTAHGLVIEFQHSHIDPQERISREIFYKNIIWIVDGTRLKRDFPRFLKGKEAFRPTYQRNTFLVDFPNECFPSAWVGSSVPIIFDFKGTEKISDPNDWRTPLYFLFPKNIIGWMVEKVSREFIINSIITGELFKLLQELQHIMNSQRQSQKYVYPREEFGKRRRF